MITAISEHELMRVWSERLWPERRSPLELRSALTRRLEIDLKLQGAQHALIARAIRDSEGRVACVSTLQQTRSGEWRLRGTWTDPQQRRAGLARALVEELLEEAELRGGQVVWTLARQASVGFYIRLGFMIESETSRFEFGPHLVMCRAI